jgi:type IV secretion system protein VirD4
VAEKQGVAAKPLINSWQSSLIALALTIAVLWFFPSFLDRLATAWAVEINEWGIVAVEFVPCAIVGGIFSKFAWNLIEMGRRVRVYENASRRQRRRMRDNITPLPSHRFSIAVFGVFAGLAGIWALQIYDWQLVAVAAGAVYVLLGVIWFCILAGLPAELPDQTQFGDAHWADLEEIQGKTRLLDSPGGIPLGYKSDESDPARPRWRKLSYSGDRHLATIAPNRSGKGITAIIPTLLEYMASCFVLDPKGENVAITARRRQRLGHKVIILNPFGVLHKELAAIGFTRFHRFNPLARLNPTANDFVAACGRIAEALVFNESKDPHWSDSARSLVECFIMHVCTEPGETRSLGRVRQLITITNPAELTRLLATMANSSYRPLRQKVSQFLATNNEIQGIQSTARIQTKDLDDPAIAESLSDSDFSFIDLKRRKMTVYLVLAGENMALYRRWLRLLLTAALNELMGSSEKGDKPVLFLLANSPRSEISPYSKTTWPILRGLEFSFGASFKI